MASRETIVIVEPDRQVRTRLIQQADLKGSLIQATGISELKRLLSADRESEVGVVMLGPNLPTEEALEVAQQCQGLASSVTMVMVTMDVSTDLLHRALRAGVKDVILATASKDEFVEAMSRVVGMSREAPSVPRAPGEVPGKKGMALTVFSVKGGSGKSFVSSNIGILLAQSFPQEVCLVDLDLESGDLAIMLQLLPAWTIHDAAEQAERLDAEALRGYLTPHDSGVTLLAAPLEPALAGGITAETVRHVLQLLKTLYSYVVVDAAPSFSDALLAALDETDLCVLMASLDVPSVKNLKLALQTLDQLGFSRDRIRVVMNRADSKVGLRLQEVEKSLGTKIDVAIPSSRDVPLSVNQGVPLAVSKSRHPAVQALRKLIDLVRSSQAQPATAGARRG